ncbi:protein phosphatase CheZ [Rhodobacterales bacterium]|nr:protein phosphatase CheZ [Rhodobacterales bacterium]
MKAEALQQESEPLGEVEYQTLEQTLMESDRGRRFLTEFLNRNKTPETAEILTAINRLEKAVTRQRKVPDMDKIRLDIADMHEAIERTKSEIANIKDEGEASNRFTDASHELDAIISQTEGATQSILEAAEQIQEKAWVLREDGVDAAACDDIDAKATEIFMACSFQDLTGQRTNKVVQVLRYLESRINLMISIWGIEDAQADEMAGPVDARPDSHLLNGPQHEGMGVSQNNVDELMSVSDDVFNAALKENDAEPVSQEPAAANDSEADAEEIMAAGNTRMDAAAIDDMFGAAGSDEDETDETPDAGEPEEIESETLNDDDIDKMFETAPDAAAAAEEEEEADEEWEMTAEEAEADDPLEQLTEAERQALFN